jgi:hypothetical protein
MVTYGYNGQLRKEDEYLLEDVMDVSGLGFPDVGSHSGSVVALSTTHHRLLTFPSLAGILCDRSERHRHLPDRFHGARHQQGAPCGRLHLWHSGQEARNRRRRHVGNDAPGCEGRHPVPERALCVSPGKGSLPYPKTLINKTLKP